MKKDSKIETGVPYSFTSIREPFGQLTEHEKAVAHLVTKRVTVLSPADLGAQLKPTKLIHFNIENM
jgi:hypothetical protein